MGKHRFVKVIDTPTVIKVYYNGIEIEDSIFTDCGNIINDAEYVSKLEVNGKVYYSKTPSSVVIYGGLEERLKYDNSKFGEYGFILL